MFEVYYRYKKPSDFDYTMTQKKKNVYYRTTATHDFVIASNIDATSAEFTLGVGNSGQFSDIQDAKLILKNQNGENTEAEFAYSCDSTSGVCSTS